VEIQIILRIVISNMAKGLQGASIKIRMETKECQGSGQEEWPDVGRRMDVGKYIKTYMSRIDCHYQKHQS
jgi:hypothetical protein